VERLGVPTVSIGYQEPPNGARVASDMAAVAAMAAEHFLTRGFRHFAFYESVRTRGEQITVAGFEAALAKAGHVVHRVGAPAALDAGTFDPSEDRYQLLGRQLTRLPKPLAVLSEFDDRSADVLDAAQLAGLRVPEQVAVLGVGNDELRCPLASVPLSSVDNDEERIGFEAARALQHLMDGQAVPGPVLVEPKRVVVRQSTNILAIPHEHVALALRLIWQHYTEPIDVRQIASEVPISYAQLHTSFVRHVGHTMADEIENRRLELARQLLGDPNVKLAEVARRAGFGSADRMGRVFMRRLKITPSDYRSRAMEKDAQANGAAAANSD
jgi:LacI family transcriptional regulator